MKAAADLNSCSAPQDPQFGRADTASKPFREFLVIHGSDCIATASGDFALPIFSPCSDGIRQPFILRQDGGVVFVSFQAALDEFVMLVEQCRIFSSVVELFFDHP